MRGQQREMKIQRCDSALKLPLPNILPASSRPSGVARRLSHQIALLNTSAVVIKKVTQDFWRPPKSTQNTCQLFCRNIAARWGAKTLRIFHSDGWDFQATSYHLQQISHSWVQSIQA
jgi:hypothetical protein